MCKGSDPVKDRKVEAMLLLDEIKGQLPAAMDRLHEVGGYL